MSELFDEVDEDVRRDQLKKLWDKYSIFIVAAALLVVAGVAGWRGYQYVETKKAAEASVAFDKAVELSEASKHAEAEAAFNSLAATAPSGYRMLARLRAAGEAASHDPKAAVKLYDDIAADRSVTVAASDSHADAGARAARTWRDWFAKCPIVRDDLQPMTAFSWWVLGANIITLPALQGALPVVPSKR